VWYSPRFTCLVLSVLIRVLRKISETVVISHLSRICVLGIIWKEETAVVDIIMLYCCYYSCSMFELDNSKSVSCIIFLFPSFYSF
jgi:hypothetical protein